MTVKEALLKPFKGWVTVDIPMNFGHRRPNFRFQGWVVILLLVFLSTSIAVWYAHFTAPPPIAPARQAFLATTEFGGRLRVWSYMASSDEYVDVWSTDHNAYLAATFGDLTNDGSTELLAIAIQPSPDHHSHWIILDMYTPSDSSQWQQIGSSEDLAGVAVEQHPQNVALFIDDVDGQPGNEVILMTPYYIKVYQYSTDSASFNAISIKEATAFIDGVQAHFESLAIGDVDADGQREMVLSLNAIAVENHAYIVICQDATFTDYLLFTVDAHLGTQGTLTLSNHARSLRLGDLDGDGALEICTTGHRVERVPRTSIGGLDEGTGGFISVDIDDEPYTWPRDRPGKYYQHILFIWDHAGRLILEQHFGETFNYFEMIHLALGDLDSDSTRDELALAVSTFDPSRVYIYALTEGQLQKLWHSWVRRSSSSRIIFYSLAIADANGDERNEIIVSGRYQSPMDVYSNDVGTFYLEILDSTGESRWHRLGGATDEREVWYTTIG